MKLKLIEKKDEIENIKTFIFKPEKKFSWKAGQYIIHKIAHENADLRGKQRFITISSAPYEKNITITTRIEKKPSSFKNSLNNLKIGDEIESKGPDGDMYIQGLKKTYIFTAGGIGVTPFWSILKQLNYEKKKINIILFYANKNKNFLFKKEIEEFASKNKKMKIFYFISPKKITKENFLNLNVNLKNSMFFTSGPELMIYKIEDIIEKLGVKRENMKQDYFTGYKKI